MMDQEPIRVVQVVWIDEDHVAVQHSPDVRFEHMAVAAATILRAANKIQDAKDKLNDDHYHEFNSSRKAGEDFYQAATSGPKVRPDA